MITTPTIAQILQTLSHDLRQTIAPALDDEALRVKVQMMGPFWIPWPIVARANRSG